MSECKCSAFGPKPHVSDEVMADALLTVFKATKVGEPIRMTLLGQAIGNWEEFRRGFNEEFEHGCRSPETNITCDDNVATARIVLAHLKEEPDYYTRHGLGSDG